MTTIDLRGRDLTITPSAELLELPTPALLDTLFGPYLPKAVRGKMGRDKRFHFLRTQPIHFSAVKQALHRLRQRYRLLLREEIAHTVSEPTDVEDELRHFISVLQT